MGAGSHCLLVLQRVAVRPGGGAGNTSPGRFLVERHTICHSVRMSASQNDTLNAISAAQVRAARALIGWTRDQLATASDVPMRTVARFEMGEGTPQRRTLTAIRAALEAAGVEFIPENGGGAGVRMKQRQSELPGVTIGC